MEDRGTMDLTKQIEDLTKLAQEAEGELSIIRGIGNNSPEMKALQKQKEILQAACRRAGAEIKSLKDTIVKLEQRVEDVLNPLRKDGLL